jgi:hypothetical protein
MLRAGWGSTLALLSYRMFDLCRSEHLLIRSVVRASWLIISYFLAMTEATPIQVYVSPEEKRSLGQQGNAASDAVAGLDSSHGRVGMRASPDESTIHSCRRCSCRRSPAALHGAD